MQLSCAHHGPHYTAQALRARGKRAVVLPYAFGLPAIVAGWTSSATSTASAAAANTATTTMHSPTHRRIETSTATRKRCTARPLFTRPAWPRRALRSHDYQRAPRKLSEATRGRGLRYAKSPRLTLCSHDCQRTSRKLSVHAVALCSPCEHHSPHYIAHVAGWT